MGGPALQEIPETIYQVRVDSPHSWILGSDMSVWEVDRLGRGGGRNKVKVLISNIFFVPVFHGDFNVIVSLF